MHVGPSVGNYDVLKASLNDHAGFSSPEFVEAMHNTIGGLRYVTGADGSYLPFIIPGSGTSAMESMMSFLRKGDPVLVVSNGVFGDRWKYILERYDVHLDFMSAGAGDSVTPSGIREKFGSKRYRMSFCTHVETSTGVRSPAGELAGELRRISDFVVLDGIASVGGEHAAASEWNVDAYITASQKAIGAPPGAGIAVVSEKLIKDMPEDSLAGYSLNLRNWLPVMRAFEKGEGKYFATPPVHTILALSHALSMIREESMSGRIKRHENVRNIIAEGIEKLGLETVARKELRSNTVTGVLFSNHDANRILESCYRLGIEFAAGVHPSLAGKYIRIGHMGWVSELDAVAAVSVIERAMKEQT